MATIVRFTPEGKESLRELHIDTQRVVKREIKKLGHKPFLGKQLDQALHGLRSLRVTKKYRVVYAVLGELVAIVLVGHRREVYDRLLQQPNLIEYAESVLKNNDRMAS